MISIKQQLLESKKINKNVLDFLHYLKNVNLLIIKPEHIYKLFKFKTRNNYKKKKFFKSLNDYVEKGFLRPVKDGKFLYYQINLMRFKIENLGL